MSQAFTAKSAFYRRKAAMCENFADRASSAVDRARLTRMRQSWLALAANEEWLDGLPPLPPANVIAFAAA